MSIAAAFNSVSQSAVSTIPVAAGFSWGTALAGLAVNVAGGAANALIANALAPSPPKQIVIGSGLTSIDPALQQQYNAQQANQAQAANAASKPDYTLPIVAGIGAIALVLIATRR